MCSVYTLAEFLSPEECDKALRLFLPPTERGLASSSGSTSYSLRSKRRSRVSFLQPDASSDWLRATVWGAVQRANEVTNSHFDLAGLEPMQLAEYGDGDGYGPHLDIGPGPAARRKLSASVQLSDPSDYDGGDLAIWGADRTPRERGALIVFPSYMLHWVSPVTRGRRLSMVAWAIGDAPYR